MSFPPRITLLPSLSEAKAAIAAGLALDPADKSLLKLSGELADLTTPLLGGTSSSEYRLFDG